MIDPIEKTIDVPLAPSDAFALFTERLSDWWPRASHSLSGHETAPVRVEPREGGQIIETLPDGTEAPWARITAWDPGKRLAVKWHVGKDEAEHTELDVTFTPIDTGTRVRLVHDGFDRLADGATRAQGYDTGWDHVFKVCYGGACQSRAA